MVASRLLEKGANVNAFNRDSGETPLMIVLGHLHDSETIALRWVELLMGNDADVNVVHPVHKGTPLSIATKANQPLGIIQMLLDGPNLEINARDADSLSALFYAVIHNNVPVVSALLDAGADKDMRVDRYSKKGTLIACQQNPIEYAILHRSDEVAALLVPAMYFGLGHPPPLDLAASHKLPQTIAAFMKRGDIDANLKVRGRLTALEHVTGKGHSCPQVASILMKHGADANVHSRGSRRTPLLDTIAADDVEMLDIVLRHDVDLNVPAGKFNMTPLQVAVCLGKTSMVRKLLAQGADWRPGLGLAMPEPAKAAVQAEFRDFFRCKGAEDCAVLNAVRHLPIPRGSELFALMREFVEPMPKKEFEDMKQAYFLMGGTIPRIERRGWRQRRALEMTNEVV